jgi:CRISPR-associated protein Cmr1
VRTIKNPAPAIPPPQKTPATVTKTFDVELITPLYGGGAVAGVNDQDFPIRPTSVRGQLRFWWRATLGAGFDNSDDLYNAESAVWGNTKTPSVVVKVNAPTGYSLRRDIGQRDDNYGFRRFGPEAYVLFPAAANTSRHNLVKEGLKFKVEISYKAAIEKDVLCSVWSWLNFGGIGARTRRGCGALFCPDVSPQSPESIGKWFQANIEHYELEHLTARRDWPTLSSLLWGENSTRQALEAWGNIISLFKNFRQGKDLGRNPGSGGPRLGRSYWPEPDTLRRVIGRHSQGHAPETGTNAKPDGFPRAAFGLPIGFKFFGSRGDPERDLYPMGAERMGSPVILRPLKTKDGGSVPLAVHLNARMPADLEIKGHGSPGPTANRIVASDFATYRNSPMNGRSASGNAVEAFLQYLRSQRYRNT